MDSPENVIRGRRTAVLFIAGVTLGSLPVHAAPRRERKEAPDRNQQIKLIGVSRIDELPPLPPGARPNTMVQPLGIPVPVFEVASDQMAARGSVANAGSAKAVVYRNPNDAGFAHHNKPDAGNFTGNLLHLGNGFPLGGSEISGYDLLVYNDAAGPDAAGAARVSLWNGDPLGLIDTRISNPPREIPGTVCTFTQLAEFVVPPPWGCTQDTDG
ncbi:MAG: hypothetical protein PVI86_08330, partial [Phycisphaerae bacterium]